MEQWLRLLEDSVPITSQIMSKVLVSLALVLILFLIHVLIVRMAWRRVEDAAVRYRWRKSSGYAAVIIGLALLGLVWFEALRTIGTFLGLLSAGIAIALKDLVANVAGWVFILWRRPFEVGDRIQIGDLKGDVIDVRIFQFTLMEVGGWVESDQSTGRVIHVPNGMVLSRPLANYAKGFKFIWNEIPVLLTFESDWEKAKALLQEIAESHPHSLDEKSEKKVRASAKKYLIIYSKLTPIVYTSVRESGVLLTVRFLCHPRRRRGAEEAIWEEVLRRFKLCPDISFAYPTQRIVAGKKGMPLDNDEMKDR